MITVNIHKAKTDLSRLIKLALEGEEIIIAKYGEPLVTITPLKSTASRKPGYWKNKIKISPDFDDLPDDILKVFTGQKE